MVITQEDCAPYLAKLHIAPFQASLVGSVSRVHIVVRWSLIGKLSILRLSFTSS